MSKNIRKQPAEVYLQNLFPGLVFVKTDNYLKVSDKIEHKVIEADNLTMETKLDLLLQLIQSSQSEYFVIFAQKNESVRQISQFLVEQDVPVVDFHSDMKEAQRVEHLFKFRSGKYPVFVCGDSANRGLHFDFDAHVVQFDSAQNAINLLHRFGRTGRLGKKGKVTSFVCEADYALLTRFQDLMENAKRITPIVTRKRSFSKNLKRKEVSNSEEQEI